MGNNTTSQNVEYGELIPNDICITWKNVEKQTSLPAREGQCCCGHNKTLYIFGGVLQGHGDTEPQESNDLLAFDTDANKWEKINVTGKVPPPRSTASIVAIGNKLYLFGGLSHLSGWFDVVHEYDIESKTWTEVSHEGKPPAPRDKLTAVAIGTNIFYFGGFGPKSEEMELDDSEDEEELPDGGASFGWFNDMFVYDTVNKKWSQPMQFNLSLPTPRAAHGMCAVGKDLVIFGGRDTECRRNDLHIYDTESRKWKDFKVKGRQPEPRSFHSTTAVGNRVVVMGGRGEQNQHYADLHIFDTETMEWLQPKVSGDLPVGRGQHSVGVVDNQVVLFGGTSDFSTEIMQCQTFHKDTFVANIGATIADLCTTPVQRSAMVAPDKHSKQGSLYGFKFAKNRDWV